MPYCEACGAQVSTTAKFCGNCGASRNPSQPTLEPTKPTQTPKPAAQSRLNYYSPPNMAYVPQAPYPIIGSQVPSQPSQHYQPQPQIVQSPTQIAPASMQPTPAPIQQAMPTQNSGETTIGVILFRRLKSLGRYDTYAAVVTSERMIFAQLTADMLNQAAQQARDQAKAEGKGFFGQWADQLKNTFGYTKKYLDMPPQAILAETPGNFALYNNSISEVKIRHKGQGDEYTHHHEFETEIKTSQGNYKYRMDENSQFTDILKRVYGERVKMPFGYFGKSININI